MSAAPVQGAPGSAVRRLAAAVARDLPPLVVLAVLAAEPATRDFALANLVVQAVVIVCGACLPAWRTGVMAVVDGAWPWGLALIGVQTLVFGDVGEPVTVVVAVSYLAVGLRGGLWAAVVAATDFPRDDLPRYRYRRLVWRQEGYRSETLPMLHEILQQGLLNMSILATPAMLVVAAPVAVGVATVAGALLWAVSFALESLADVQKARFARRQAATAETGTCEAGLWARSRHPNYFFQWLQWHGLILVALPSLLRLGDDVGPLAWSVLAVALLGISALMYWVLVHYTGAIPAEHFSVQRRPGYRDYQRRVNRFVPGRRR